MIPSTWVSGSIDRLAEHSRVPLFRNAYALIVSSGATSALGLVYWILAARIYSPDAVGFNAAAISAMMFLAGLSQLNLLSALVRFIPEAGRKARRFALLAYGISIAVALVASLAFIAGVHYWAPALGPLAASPMLIVWFAAATMAWSVFVLEDSVITGLRRTPWVPVSNGVFATAKIVLLIALAGFVPLYGIFASWTMSLACALALTNLVIFARLFPRHPSRTIEPAESLSVRSVARYASTDYVASLFWLTCTTLLPVIITSQVGLRATAYFFLAWQIGYSLHILSISTGSSLVVEAVTTRHELADFSRRMFRQNLYITIPLAAVIVFAAPYVMEVFGPGYKAQATTLLRLLALASVPFSVVALAISVARVQRRMRRVVLVNVAMCLMVLALTEVLIKPMGLTGVGVAWLTTQGILAGLVLVTQLRPLWAGVDVTDRTRLAAGMPAVGAAAPFGNIRMRPALWARSVSGVLRQLSRLRSYWRHTQFVFGLNQIRPELLAGIPTISGHPSRTGWVIRRVVSVTSDIAVLTLASSGSEADVAVLKLSRTEGGAASLRRGAELISHLNANPDLASLHHLLPQVLGRGQVGGYTFTVEQALPGIDARILLSDPGRTARMQEAAAATIQVLQTNTGSLTVVGDDVARRWVDAPVATIGRLAGNQPGIERNLATLERMRQELRQRLIGRRVLTTWVHGDFVPGNILIAPGSDSITGLIDWDQAGSADLPMVDIVQLLLASHVAGGNRELGELVAGLLGGVPLSDRELELIERIQSQLGGDRFSIRELVLLCWLRHISGNLSKSRTYARHSWWVRRNVEQVLRAYSSSGAVTEAPRPGPAAAPIALDHDRQPQRRSGSRVGPSSGRRAGIRPRPIPIPILLYHSISSQPSRAIAPFAVSPEAFVQHLDLIADGHVALTVSQLVSLLDNGEAIPAGALVITFDDGFADNLEVAAPLLQARRLPATIYLTTSQLAESAQSPHERRGKMLSWSALDDLEAAGFEIGAHGHHHRQFDVLPINTVAHEIARCKELLEGRVGHRVATFAYPHGYSSPDVRQAVRAAGFEAACGVKNALSHPFDDRWSIARLTVRSDTPTTQVAAWLRGQGAPLASGEALVTGAWRTVRRVRQGAVSAILAGS
jgi:peptidoglycan/xylan/chitin deacetylase (PgdA/CDA1 family)/O-antigen/teichoic acid export membrane protein/aminoglycoside phosphotransferase